MTRYLVATASTDTTEAACNYLEPKLEPSDEVYVITIEEEARPITDRDEVLTAAQLRLAGNAEVRTIRRSGDPDLEIVTFARERDVDEIILGPMREGSGIGSTTRSVLNKVEVPVFVVPPQDH